MVKTNLKHSDVNFDFLGDGKFNLQLIKDGDDGKSFTTETVTVKRGDVIGLKCLPRGGFVGILKMQNK